MDCKFTVNVGDTYRIFVNDRLVLEGVGAVVEGAAEFEHALAKARALAHVPRLLADVLRCVSQPKELLTPQTRTERVVLETLTRGLVEGLLQHDAPHSASETVRMQPEYGKVYDQAYRLGRALAKIHEVVR